MKKIGGLTIIDIAIILFVCSAVVYGFIRTADIDSNQEVFTFDVSDISKVETKYSEFYSRGKVVESKISGYNSLTKRKEEIRGEVLWVGYLNGYLSILIDVNGEKLLAGPYQNKFADFYIDSITLQATGKKDAVDVVIKPRRINRISDLIIDVPGVNYELTTNIPIKNYDVSKFQELSKELYIKEKYVPINLNVQQERIEIFKATPSTLKIADRILGM